MLCTGARSGALAVDVYGCGYLPSKSLATEFWLIVAYAKRWIFPLTYEYEV